MSCNYAEGLSPYPNKGQVGMPVIHDGPELLYEKSVQLARMIKASAWTVFHTGAGCSTSAGIPDFRGPNGVWTLEKAGMKPEVNVSFDNAQPTYTHLALRELHRGGHLRLIINQNIDGLHLKAGTPLDVVSDMHGNVFIEECHKCRRQNIRETCVPTVGLKFTGNNCPFLSKSGKLNCRGRMKDTILDWEDDLPEQHYEKALHNSKNAQLSVCLGTSLQIYPCRDFPKKTKSNGGQLVIVNLQKTPLDKFCDLRIFGKVDEVMRIVCQQLSVEVREVKIKNQLTYKNEEVDEKIPNIGKTELSSDRFPSINGSSDLIPSIKSETKENEEVKIEFLA